VFAQTRATTIKEFECLCGMAERILSPDGSMMLIEGEWIPYPPAVEAHTIQDSVVMGDVKTEVIHKHQHNHNTAVHNTIVQDSEKLIRSHISTMIDAMYEGRLADAKAIFERAKQIDYEMANNLHNGEYYPHLVNALYMDAENYFNSTIQNYRFNKRRETMPSYIQNINNYCMFGISKIQTVLQWDPRHIPTLMLNAEILRKGNLSNSQKNIERIYNSVLLIDPNHKLARYNLERIIRNRKIKNSIIIGSVLFILILLMM